MLDAIERARQAPRHESILEEVRREVQTVAVQKANNYVSAAPSAPCLPPRRVCNPATQPRQCPSTNTHAPSVTTLWWALTIKTGRVAAIGSFMFAMVRACTHAPPAGWLYNRPWRTDLVLGWPPPLPNAAFLNLQKLASNPSDKRPKK